MAKQAHILLVVCVSSCLLSMASAQTAPPASNEHKKFLLGATSFIDIGPPFDTYSLYELQSTASGTDVERITVTPPDDTCLAPAKTYVSKAHISQSIDDLLNHKDPCMIPDKTLRREVKRCKRCLTFSGIHVVAQLQCNGKPRSIRYEVLDRDIFGSKPNTPLHPSQSIQLLEKLDQAFGKSDFDTPIFPTSAETPQRVPLDETVQELSTGSFDNLFAGDSISQLYKDSQQPPRSPAVTIEASPSFAPINPKMPNYPPIARAVHIAGIVAISITTDAAGKVVAVTVVSGPELLRGPVIDTAKNWIFPQEAANHSQEIRVKFDSNCYTFTVTNN